VGWAERLATGFGFKNAAYSLAQLLTMLSGGATDAGSRLDAYLAALRGFAASPLVGSLFGGEAALGMHSDLLDLLSAGGLLGTAAFALGAWWIGHGAAKGIRQSPAFAHVVLQWALLFCCVLLGTVFYSREISLALCLATALLIWEKPQDVAPRFEDSTAYSA